MNKRISHAGRTSPERDAVRGRTDQSDDSQCQAPGGVNHSSAVPSPAALTFSPLDEREIFERIEIKMLMNRRRMTEEQFHPQEFALAQERGWIRAVSNISWTFYGPDGALAKAIGE